MMLCQCNNGLAGALQSGIRLPRQEFVKSQTNNVLGLDVLHNLNLEPRTPSTDFGEMDARNLRDKLKSEHAALN